MVTGAQPRPLRDIALASGVVVGLVPLALQPVEPANKLREHYPQEKLWKLRAGREMRVVLERLSATEFRVLGIHKKSERQYFSDAN